MKVFGQNPSGSRLKRLKESENYNGKTFLNIESTDIISKNISSLSLLKDFVTRSKSISPAGRIPSVINDFKDYSSEKPGIVWFGHSSFVVFSPSVSILVDPVLNANASPFDFFGRPFNGSCPYTVNDLPFIDIVVITHDHYDHLCYRNILELRGKCNKFIVPLGVGSHLEYWGIDPGKIIELDWWQSEVINTEISIVATPSRHFSGRMLTRNKTLWCSYVLTIKEFRIFICGNSGYGTHFKMIGQRYDTFNLAILECGQYGHGWPHIHMLPEETVMAAVDLNAEVFMPVHWGKYSLSLHPWNQPVKRAFASSQKLGLNMITPVIGELFFIGDPPKQTKWWDFE